MRLEDVGIVNHGIVLARIKPVAEENQEERILFTMQDLSSELGNLHEKSEDKIVIIDRENRPKEIADEKMVVIGLTAQKAYRIEEQHIGKIIPSNFVYLRFDEDKVDLDYFTWYFNEHPNVQRQVQKLLQGTGAVMFLSVQMIRELEIDLPDINLQKELGEMYRLMRAKEKALYARHIAEQKYYRQIMINKLAESE